ncbi:MAG: ArsA family ATPase [Candidatus Dormibacteria bacterium]
MRVILYTGKGGVGKTSVAAATALMCARRGQRTLLLSTDPAHSVADSFDIKSGGRQKLNDNLYIHEVDALTELEANWNRVHTYMTRVLASQGIDDIVAEELASPPGMGEVAALMWIRKYYKEEQFDVLVVDCAPTGETLQLLSFPEVARWWLNKVFPIERRMMKVARPVLSKMTDIPLPDDSIYASIKDLLMDLDGTRTILADPRTTSIRLVMNLEKMVIKEAQRAYTYLNLYDYQTDAVVVNRVIPADTDGTFMAGWRKSQQGYEKQVEAAFGTLPILHGPLFEREVVGEEMLMRLGEAIFGDEDPSRMMATHRAQRMHKEGKDYVLSLELPFVSRDEINLVQREGDLYVTVGPYRREISLPRVLARRKTRSAKFDASGKVLNIHFSEEVKGAAE